MKTLIKTISSFWSIAFHLNRSRSATGTLVLFVKIVLAFIYWKLIGKKFFVFNLAFEGRGFVFHANGRVDFAALHEVFVDREYEFPYSQDPKVIVDIGANVGDTAIYYSLLFPKAKIYVIEPNPNVHENLERNVKQFNNVTICKLAIAPDTGSTAFFFGDSHLGSSVNKRDQHTKSLAVASFTLEDFCKNYGISEIDILKFDIEGGEEYLLASPTIRFLVKELAGEIHADLVSVSASKLVDDLQLKDFQVKKLSKDRSIVFGRV